MATKKDKPEVDKKAGKASSSKPSTAAAKVAKKPSSKKVAAKPKAPAAVADESISAESVAVPRLKQLYADKVQSALMAEYSYKNVMQVPRLIKIVINIGLGQAVANPNLLKTAVDELSQIAGQRAVITKAKKAIANFKLREGLGIGCMVTLRRQRMWEFLDRLQSVAMPRIRDFKGMSPTGFDGHGNYTCGLRDQTIFPEIVYEQIDLVKGMNITVATTAKTDAEGRSLLKHLGMPFRS
jgi:large subunit ribosomal protein L5